MLEEFKRVINILKISLTDIFDNYPISDRLINFYFYAII